MSVSVTKSKPYDLTIPHDCRGQRLDQALARLLPDMGRRGVRRLLGANGILVDGAARVAGFRVSGGEQVRISCPDEVDGKAAPEQGRSPVIDVAARSDSFAAVVKPAGMHTEAVAGSAEPHIAALLPELFPLSCPVLLNRLDRPVSGLVLAALNQGAVHDYKAWQDQGAVYKHYLAVVSGQVTEAMEIRLALDTAKRRKVRVMSQEEPDPLRWTRVFPASYREATGESLVRAEIRKGRRHQIRAHLAFAGHPVKSDPLYGAGPDQGWIYLHHCRVVMPGLAACSFPEWKGWKVRAEWLGRADTSDARQVQAL